MNDLVGAHFTKLNKSRPFLSYFQAWVSILLAWWLVPITLFLFSGRTCAGMICSVTSVMPFCWPWPSSLPCTLSHRRRTLRDEKKWVFLQRSHQSSKHVRPPCVCDNLNRHPSCYLSGCHLWQRRFIHVANDGSRRLPSFCKYQLCGCLHQAFKLDRKSVAELDLVKGADLASKDLRHARAYQTFFVHANLKGSQMEKSSLEFADFRRADAEGIHLDDALMLSSRLDEATLTAASMKRADLSKASLVSSELSSGAS